MGLAEVKERAMVKPGEGRRKKKLSYVLVVAMVRCQCCGWCFFVCLFVWNSSI